MQIKRPLKIWISSYDLLLPPDINQLTQPIVCKIYKVDNRLQPLKKNYYK